MKKKILLIGGLLLTQGIWAADYSLKVTKKGFEPKSLNVKAGEDTVLKIIRITDATCAKQILIPSKKLKINLPLNKEVTVSLGKLFQGKIKFACEMKMMGGVIVVK